MRDARIEEISWSPFRGFRLLPLSLSAHALEIWDGHSAPPTDRCMFFPAAPYSRSTESFGSDVCQSDSGRRRESGVGSRKLHSLKEFCSAVFVIEAVKRKSRRTIAWLLGQIEPNMTTYVRRRRVNSQTPVVLVVRMRPPIAFGLMRSQWHAVSSNIRRLAKAQPEPARARLHNQGRFHLSSRVTHSGQRSLAQRNVTQVPEHRS